MSPSCQGGYTLSLPGFDTEAPAYPDLFAEAAEAPAAAVDVQAVVEVQVPKAWRPAMSAAAHTAQLVEWPTWDDEDLAHIEGQATKFEANVSAINALRSIESEARPASASERRALLRYTGWGGIPASFNDEGRDPAWVERAGRLRQLLSADDHDSARASVSFDAYSWQTVLTKAKFIAQVMSGDKGIRSVEDVELATLTYAEVKALASGNPKIIEKAGVDAEIAKYASLLSVWRNQRYANESEVAGLPMRIESNERLLAALVADAERAHAVLGTDLVVNIHGRTHRGREEIGEVLRATVRSARASISRSARDEVIGTVGAFELCVFIGRAEDEVHLFVRGASSHECRPCQTGPALHASLIETIREIAPHRDDCAQRLARMRSKLEGLAAELQRPFEHEDRLAALIARQRELEAELDLGKDEVGSNAVEDVPEQIAA